LAAGRRTIGLSRWLNSKPGSVIPQNFHISPAFVGFWIFSLYDDAIVSADLGFMKHAFEALWQPGSQKRFFTPEAFVAFLSQL